MEEIASFMKTGIRYFLIMTVPNPAKHPMCKVFKESNAQMPRSLKYKTKISMCSPPWATQPGRGSLFLSFITASAILLASWQIHLKYLKYSK